MRETGCSKIHRLSKKFRLYTCLVVCCMLTLAETAIIAKPVQACCANYPQNPPIAVEGEYYSYTFNTDFCQLQPWCHYEFEFMGTICSILDCDPLTGTISGTPPSGSAGTYTGAIYPKEYCDNNLAAEGQGGEQGVWLCFIFTIVEPGNPTHSVVPTSVEPCTYNFTVSIGRGLTESTTKVYIDGKEKANLGGGQSKKFQAIIGESPIVMVEKAVPDTGSKKNQFVVKGNNETKVSQDNGTAYFDYNPAFFIEFKTDPYDITTLPGSDFYSPNAKIQSSAPITVELPSEPGTRYLFNHWTTPSGEKIESSDLVMAASNPGSVTAFYNKQYKLILDYPYEPKDEGTWYDAGVTAEWKLEPSQVPMSGIAGFLGCKMKAANTTGHIIMDGPKSITVNWIPVYTILWIIVAVIVVLVIGGVGYFAYRRYRPSGEE